MYGYRRRYIATSACATCLLLGAVLVAEHTAALAQDTLDIAALAVERGDFCQAEALYEEADLEGLLRDRSFLERAHDECRALRRQERTEPGQLDDRGLEERQLEQQPERRADSDTTILDSSLLMGSWSLDPDSSTGAWVGSLTLTFGVGGSYTSVSVAPGRDHPNLASGVFQVLEQQPERLVIQIDATSADGSNIDRQITLIFDANLTSFSVTDRGGTGVFKRDDPAVLLRNAR